MTPMQRNVAQEHVDISRRYFLRLGVAGFAALQAAPLWAGGAGATEELERLVRELEYLTPAAEFRPVERGDPLPYKLPLEKRLEVGLERETWKLEVIPDADTPAKVKNPLTAEDGTAFTFADLVELGKTKAVRFLKIMTCNNIGAPLGVGLWEGVPLRDVVWLAKPKQRVRRLFYYGYHNDDPKQMFRSSLPIGRVLEDPPGMLPVILAYKLNGDWLTGVRGGPVRMVVPEAYGFKSVKWLTHVVLTDLYHANDTYATMAPNDVDSKMKTFARFLHRPETAAANTAIPLTGLAQVGMSGIARVEYSVAPHGTEVPADDPYLTRLPWKTAELLPQPAAWGGDLPDGELQKGVLGFEPGTQKAERWPLRYSMAHWAVLAEGLAAGKWTLRCRTVDANGSAQPMPRPFAMAGRNKLDAFDLEVKG